MNHMQRRALLRLLVSFDADPPEPGSVLEAVRGAAEAALQAAPPSGARVDVPVAVLEFNDGGNALWIHNARGATVLRLTLTNGFKFRARYGCENISAHTDVTCNPGKDVSVCLLGRPEPQWGER